MLMENVMLVLITVKLVLLTDVQLVKSELKELCKQLTVLVTQVTTKKKDKFIVKNVNLNVILVIINICVLLVPILLSHLLNVKVSVEGSSLLIPMTELLVSKNVLFNVRLVLKITIIVVNVLKESKEVWKLLNVLVLKDSTIKMELSSTVKNVQDYVKLALMQKPVTHVKPN